VCVCLLDRSFVGVGFRANAPPVPRAIGYRPCTPGCALLFCIRSIVESLDVHMPPSASSDAAQCSGSAERLRPDHVIEMSAAAHPADHTDAHCAAAQAAELALASPPPVEGEGGAGDRPDFAGERSACLAEAAYSRAEGVGPAPSASDGHSAGDTDDGDSADGVDGVWFEECKVGQRVSVVCLFVCLFVADQAQLRR
jgi:hypothetical protein